MNTGGPAFPVPSLVHNGHISHGMTLRDYFAAKAMQAMLLNQPPHDTDEPYSAYASDAYEIADAMLKAREE